ncbi:MAG: alpha/beta hydrolase [Pseudomonadota bacterium]
MSPNSFTKSGTAYTRFGIREAPTVIMIHGLGLTRETWRDHVPSYAAHFDVITYDLRGHGDSARCPENATLSVFSEQLVDLMDELSIESASLVGFSLGGMINRRFAIDHTARTDSLVILNSPHERGEHGQQLVEERARQSASGGPGATIDETIKRWFTEDFISSRPQRISEIKNWVLANDHEQYATCRFVLAAGVVELIRPFPPIACPTLVVTCEHDSGSTPSMSYAISSEIEGSETIIVPHLQHMGLVEKPGLFSALAIDFLRRSVLKKH